MSSINKLQFLTIIFITLAWAACFPLIELGHRAAPPLMFAAFRSLIAGLTIIFPLLFFNRFRFFDLGLWKSSFYIAITYTVLGFGGMFLADGRVPSGIATVLTNTQPLITAVLAYFFLSESLNKQSLLGLLVSFLGILFIASGKFSDTSSSGSFIGFLFVLLGAFGTGAGNVFMKRLVDKFDPIVLIGMQYVIGSMILFPLSYVFENNTPIDWHPSFFWSLITLAIPGTAVATILWIRLLKKIELVKLNMFTFLTPTFGLIIGYIVFNERYFGNDIFGIVLILLGIFLTMYKSKEVKPD
ncbi:MAG: EamA family transporter [Halobacteriovorax sp.]|nr:EamA family transporter [Halobacteriovorax sp.]|tara:strand:- start:86091 stop:86987 length:897 start_codon:yes stop_codon:yes gene_type:complete